MRVNWRFRRNYERRRRIKGYINEQTKREEKEEHEVTGGWHVHGKGWRNRRKRENEKEREKCKSQVTIRKRCWTELDASRWASSCTFFVLLVVYTWIFVCSWLILILKQIEGYRMHTLSTRVWEEKREKSIKSRLRSWIRTKMWEQHKCWSKRSMCETSRNVTLSVFLYASLSSILSTF